MSLRFLAILALGVATTASAQDSYKLEKSPEGPPEGVAPSIKETLGAGGHRVLDGEGKPIVELWLRKAIPASGKPAGSKGAVLYPVLAEGELIGVARFASEGHDYHDQTIAPGVYTLRYGLQPINGAHLGVSTNRDYMLLLPAAKDTDPADLESKHLGERSAESVGTSHPGVLLLLAPPEKPAEGSSLVNDPTLNTWGAVLTLPLQVKGEADSVPLPLQLVVVGSKTD